jgi:hypothetical protein
LRRMTLAADPAEHLGFGARRSVTVLGEERHGEREQTDRQRRLGSKSNQHYFS